MAKIKRSELREMVGNSIRKYLREEYGDLLDGGVDTAAIKKMFDGLRSNSFDMSEEGGGEVYFYYDPSSNQMIAGYASNAGISQQWKLEYDDHKSLDQNLEALYELISQDLHDNAEFEQFESKVRKKITNIVMESIMRGCVNEDAEDGDGGLSWWNIDEVLQGCGWDMTNSYDGKYQGHDATRIEIEARRGADSADELVGKMQELLNGQATVKSSVGTHRYAPELKQQSLLIIWN